MSQAVQNGSGSCSRVVGSVWGGLLPFTPSSAETGLRSVTVDFVFRSVFYLVLFLIWQPLVLVIGAATSGNRAEVGPDLCSVHLSPGGFVHDFSSVAGLSGTSRARSGSLSCGIRAAAQLESLTIRGDEDRFLPKLR